MSALNLERISLIAKIITALGHAECEFSVRRSFFPEEVIIDLARSNQILKLFESSKGAVLKNLGSHIDISEEIIELACPTPCVPVTFKVRQTLANFFKRDPITPVISAGSAKSQLTTRKCLGHNFRNLLNAVIVRGVADIKDLVVNGLAWRFQNGDNGAGNVQAVH